MQYKHSVRRVARAADYRASPAKVEKRPYCGTCGYSYSRDLAYAKFEAQEEIEQHQTKHAASIRDHTILMVKWSTIAVGLIVVSLGWLTVGYLVRRHGH